MPDVPAQVLYGQVVGHFVKFIADTGDVGNVPDEVPLTGKVTLAPLTTVMRWATTTPPRLAVPDTIVCDVLGGDLAAPGGGSVYVIASQQPDAEPTLCQWKATFAFDGVKTQPVPVTFEVPSNGVVDLSQAIGLPPEPPVITVVSTESEAAAANSASASAASAQDAWDAANSIDQGPPGPSGTVSVVATNTLPAGSAATVTDGDPSPTNAALTFGIPKGDLGPSGVIVLSAAAPVPGGTPVGTIVLRTAT